MKKTILTILLITLTTLTSCSQEETKTIEKYYKTETVWTWNISIWNSYVWYTDSFNKLNLWSETGWKITNITKEKWDSVRKWELLVSINNDQAIVWYNTATNISETLKSMKTSTADMFDKQILALESSIEKAKAQSSWITNSIEDTKNITENNLQTAQAQIEKAKVWLETAKVNLEETKNSLNTKETQIYENTKNAITQSVILDTNIIDYIDHLLWITKENKDKNNSIEDYLWTKDRWQINETKNKFKEVNKLFLEYKALYEEKIENKSPTREEIIEISEKWMALAEELKTLLNNTYDTINNSIANVKLTQETINKYKSEISDFWGKVEASLLTVSWEYLLWLKWSLENMDSFDSESKLRISLLEKQVSIAEEDIKIAEKTYNNYKSMWVWNLTNISTQEEVSKKTIEEIKANIESLKKQKTAKLEEIDAQIKASSGEQALSSAIISNWKIVSSIDWIVIEKNFKKWEVVWIWTPIITIATNDKIKVIIWVSDELGWKLKVWDTANIELVEEAKQKTGKITNIFPTKNEITKKIWVEISIDNQNKEIKIGSMVKVYFEAGSETWTIIPNKAIISKFMTPWIMQKQWNTAKFTEIKILKQNDSFSLVEGIEVWSEIIIEGQENIYDGEEL